MPRVTHVKKARKDNPAVKKGEPYYHWDFRYGGRRYSKTYPKPSQLTQSGFLSQMYALTESDVPNMETEDDFESWKSAKVSELEEMRDMSQESLDNMPEHLQETSSAGELLTERIDECDNMISEVESAEIQMPDDVDEDDYDDEAEMIEAKLVWEDEKSEAFAAAIDLVNEACEYQGG